VKKSMGTSVASTKVTYNFHDNVIPAKAAVEKLILLSLRAKRSNLNPLKFNKIKIASSRFALLATTFSTSLKAGIYIRMGRVPAPKVFELRAAKYDYTIIWLKR
jgi:hypothetical protein